MIPWVITREREDGQPLVDALKERGIDARCIPAIERRPLEWPALDAAGGMFFLTSPYAARLTLKHLRAGGDVARFGFAALFPATKAVLDAAGIRTEIHAVGGAVELARAVDSAPLSGQLFYPTSDAGLDSAEQLSAVEILGRKHQVRRFAAYSTEGDRALAQQLETVPQPYCVALWSPSAVDAFASAVESGAPRPLFAACVGESTRQAHDKMRIAAAAKLVPRGVDVADFIFDHSRAKRTS